MTGHNRDGFESVYRSLRCCQGQLEFIAGCGCRMRLVLEKMDLLLNLEISPWVGGTWYHVVSVSLLWRGRCGLDLERAIDGVYAGLMAAHNQAAHGKLEVSDGSR